MSRMLKFKCLVAVGSFFLGCACPLLAQTDVELGRLPLRIPSSFQNAPTLAVAENMDAPGRFKFTQGLGFFCPSTATIIQIHMSDNPLLGKAHDTTMKRFLDDFGGLSKRSWAADTYSSMFFPQPNDAFKDTAGLLGDLRSGDRKKVEKIVKQYIQSDGTLLLPLATPHGPGAPYIVSLTPGAVLKVEGGTWQVDMKFFPNHSDFGVMNDLGPDAPPEVIFVHIRVSVHFTEELWKELELPGSAEGKQPSFWWVMLAEGKDVFHADNDVLYHVVWAGFDDSSPPKDLDAVLGSLHFARPANP
jgi:hypothetical protein